MYVTLLFPVVRAVFVFARTMVYIYKMSDIMVPSVLCVCFRLKIRKHVHCISVAFFWLSQIVYCNVVDLPFF